MRAHLATLCLCCACAAAHAEPEGGDQSSDPVPTNATATARHDVVIHQPASLESLRVATESGETRVACVTCHSLTKRPLTATSTEALGAPHTGLQLKHGELACAACHDRADPTALHLASGVALPMRQALRLCSQCHGPQRRDYDHGAHGGMRGYWDLSRGPRERNHCVDCHDPHAPAFPQVLPAPPPRDRFLEAHR